LLSALARGLGGALSSRVHFAGWLIYQPIGRVGRGFQIKKIKYVTFWQKYRPTIRLRTPISKTGDCNTCNYTEGAHGAKTSGVVELFVVA
jgi:hypothetical protein